MTLRLRQTLALGTVLASLAGVSSSGAQAQTTEASAPVAEPSPGVNPEVQVKTSSGGAKRTREKEAEGTEARDRFKADTVIKSKYKLDGQPLEVDPD
jgi:hypothetical protein